MPKKSIVATTCIDGASPVGSWLTRDQEPAQKRLFRDYPRNGRGATAVASHSLRARAGRSCGDTASLGELDKLNDAGAFTVKDIPAKLKRRRKPRGSAISSRSLRGGRQLPAAHLPASTCGGGGATLAVALGRCRVSGKGGGRQATPATVVTAPETGSAFDPKRTSTGSQVTLQTSISVDGRVRLNVGLLPELDNPNVELHYWGGPPCGTLWIRQITLPQESRQGSYAQHGGY